MIRFAFLFLALALICAFQTQAQNRSTSAAQAKKQPCANAQTQSEMNQCAIDEFRKADAELNGIYQQLLLKTDRQEKLKAAQRAWIAFREADCEYEASESEGGTMEPLLRYSCYGKATKTRLNQLRVALKDLNVR
jgi:uncharacterized protein YecT (DUF1311 family)